MNYSLDKLTIRGFKSIKNLEDFELRNLNIFVGANGAGKSNLIDCFRLLQSLINGALPQYVNERGGIYDLLFNGIKVTQTIEFETLFNNREYRITLDAGAGGIFSLTTEVRKFSGEDMGRWNVSYSLPSSALQLEDVFGNKPEKTFDLPVYRAIKSWQIYHFHDTGFTAPMRGSEIIEDNKYLRADAANIAPFLYRLQQEKSPAYDDIRQACGLIAPFFDDFLLEPQKYGPKTKVSLSWHTKGSDYPMQAYHFSDGTIRFIALATALLQPEPPATIIIDEPELGLHPEAIRLLGELIQTASLKTQVIVATQSPLLLDQFAVDDIIVVNRKDGASTFERLQQVAFENWLEDYSVGELWVKNVIRGGASHE